MILEQAVIEAPGGPMRAHLALFDSKPRPAVIVLEGIYGFDRELQRITDQVANAGYVGLAIDYLRGGDPRETFRAKAVCEDVAAARDWLNTQPFVKHGKIATWGFGWGGTAAFLTATLDGLSGAIAFYGQSIARPLRGETRPIVEDVADICVPLLLVFGGHDEQIGAQEIALIRDTLTKRGKRFEIEVFPEVGHSFFREDLGTIATREIAVAWDRVQAFLRRVFESE
jgi:carboxymethylenebutenolidase